ncbi:GNAT family N-acetyltransferase [Thalassobacillus hwangdonensis]|uniref:GNAT family N-acetyltransferase n=1 Tax=Thalassobacillus hwangdonensis TaxID=546108 RepID=A0ABW3L4P5_9BACI
MITVREVRSEEVNKLHNIIQFYIYEFSKIVSEIKLENNGAFKPFELEAYWTDDHLHAFFIKLEDELIGFALVESANNGDPNTIQEYFIMAKYMGKGYGREAAKKLFNMFPGEWEVTQIENNQPARAFWRGLIDEVAEGDFVEQFNGRQYIQRFKA